MIRKFFASLGILSLSLNAFGAVALAIDVNNQICQQPGADQSSFCMQNTQNQGKNTVFGTDGIITKIVSIISLLTGVASVIMIIVGGLQYVLSTGDPNRTNTAKNTILYALIGLVVAISAQVIVRLVLSRL